MIVRELDFDREKQGIRIQFQLLRMGSDYLLLIAGGDQPHIGAITLGAAGEEEQTAARRHHREDVVTRYLHSLLQQDCPGALGIACGIHVDGISKEQIEMVTELCQEAAITVQEYWGKLGTDKDQNE